MRQATFLLPSLLCLTGAALAQGDDCSVPTAINALGSYAFDTSTATTSGFDGGGACGGGAATINQDLFWELTAPADGTYIFDTFGSSFDTKLSIHTGAGCAATCAGYNDDTGGLQSSVTVSGVSTGDVLLIQVGGFGTAFGLGSVNISQPPPPVFNPANGHYYEVVPLQVINWNDAKTNAEGMSYQGIPGHLVTIADQAEMDWLLNNLTWDRPWIGMWQDPGDPNYSEPAGGWVWVTGEPVTFTNWVPGEPNDNPAGENSVELLYNIAGSNTVNGGWNDTVDFSGTAHQMIVEYEASGPLLFCSPAAVNSSGNSATLGNSSISGPGVVHLEADGGPANQFGYFLVSASLIDPGIPVSQGFICVGAPQGRYNGVSGLSSLGQFDGAGVLQNLVGTSSVGSGFDVPPSLPSPPGGVISPGTTYYFQLWYRDGVNSNFSDALRVDF